MAHEPSKNLTHHTHSKKLWEETFDAIPDLVLIIGNDHKIVNANRALAEKVGMTKEEIIGMPCYKIIHGTDRQPDYCPHVKTHSEKIEYREEIYDENLHGYYIFSTTPLFDENGEISGVVEIAHDITHRKKAEMHIRESEEKARAVIEASMDAIIVIDGKGIISFFNPAAEKIFGYVQEEISGKKLHDVLVSDKARSRYNEKLPAFEKTGQCVVIGKTLEVTAVRKDGAQFPVELSISSFNIKGEWHSLGTVRDITERKRMEDRLREAAITDDLTGLFNRRGFLTVAEQQRKFAVRNKRKLALLYLDLNDMKDINDRFGHSEGDRALKDTAGILKKAFRESDICARLGGDEYAVLLTDHSGPGNEDVIKNHLEDRLTEYNRQSDRLFELSLSLGMAHFDPGMPCSLGELLRRADAAMYESKKQYKNHKAQGTGKSERRGHERYEVALRYWAETPGYGRMEVKNISMDGLCVRTSRQLTVNSVHDISILHSGNGGIKPRKYREI